MKKFFLMFAAAAVVIASCSKPEYIIPVDDDDPKTDDPENPNDNTGQEEGYKEKTFVVNVDIMKDVETSNWAAHPAEMPGNEILDFFDMTATEFYKGMGFCNDDAGATGISAQQENTIMFGVANENNTEDLKWIPKTAANYGHWWSKTGRMTYWQDEANDKYFYTESVIEWGLSEPDEETLAAMWTYNIGFLSGGFDGAVGDVYKATEVFFITDDDDVELYAYVQWNIKIVEAEEVKLNVVGTQTIDLELEYDGGYLHTPFEDKIDAAAIQSGIGISYNEATVYAVNADGSFGLSPGANFWFDKEGNVCGWGEGCGIDLGNNEYPEGAPVWCVCNFPDETLAGTKVTGAIAFVNPNTNNAYVIRVNVTFPGIDYLAMDVLVSYENGESPYTLSEENLAALAEALGVESVAADEIGTNYALKGINADGSLYEGDFTANNGFWYSLEGNVANWNEIAAAGYVGAYIEYRGDYTFGCGMWEDPGVTATIKFGIANGDQLAVLTFNLEVAPPAQFETEEAGVMEVSTSQPIADGYGGGQIILNATDVAGLIGEGEYTLLSLEGKPDYTANGGFWFNADGEICGWGDGAVFYIEPTEDPTVFQTGIHPDNVTEATTLKASCRLANLETMKHITLNITIVAE